MKLFDLHCDTAYKLLGSGEALYENKYHISLKKASVFENYAQVSAFFANNKLDNEAGWQRYLLMRENFISEIEKNLAIATQAKSYSDVKKAWSDKKAAFIFAVEDARILDSKLERLDTLYEHGVRILTLLWAGETCIGGSHNTETGLTEFGRDVVKRCFELGIVPDISHASAASADDTIELALKYGGKVIASHSNSYTLLPCSRNLRDRHIDGILAVDGLIGINLYRGFLAEENASMDDIISHIEYFLDKNAENNLCFGCDLDGASLPDGFSDVRDIVRICDELSLRGHSSELVEKIAWQNAMSFAKRAFG